MKETAIVWESDPLQGVYLEQLYQQAGFGVLRVTTYRALRQQLSCGLPRVVVMTLGQVQHAQIASLQRQFPFASLLVLSAQQEISLALETLEVGADDYLIKPFHPDELIMRSRVLFRRTLTLMAALVQGQNPQSLQIGDWTLIPQRYEVVRAEQIWRLNKREFRVFHYFCTHPQQLISRQHLLQLVWPEESLSRSRQLDNLIVSLRKKLKNADVQIETRYGEGYLVSLGSALDT